jgi:cytoskeletal protein CcmA (bactofilin family)
MNDPKKPPPLPLTSVAKQTLVEEGTHLKGSLSSTCPIVVHGSLEGDVEGPAITVNATGALSGKIHADVLKSEGRVAGEFDVETAELAGAVAPGTDVRANSLTVNLSVSTGKLQLAFGPDGIRRRPY